METFDELYEEQLNELMGSVGRRLGDKIAAVPDRILMKLGSQSAKGRLTLRALVANLHNNFREYCGEQGIHQPLLDDVLDFLKNRLDIALDDAMTAKLAYGANADSPAEDRDDISGVLAILNASIEKNMVPDNTVVTKLIQYAKKNEGNEIMIRRSLFRLSRSNPSAQRALAPLKEYIGSKRIDAAKLQMLFERIARLILKVTGKKGDIDSDNEDNKKSKPRLGFGPGVNDNLDEGKSEGSARDNLTKDGGAAFWDELASYGIDPKTLRSLGLTYEDDPQSLIRLLNSRYSVEMCAKIARCIMQIFAHPTISASLAEYIAPITDHAEEKSKGMGKKIYSMIERSIRLMSSPGYDKTKINNYIFQNVRGEDASAGFLAGIIICAYIAGRKIKMVS